MTDSMSETFLRLRNPGNAALTELPTLSFAEFKQQAINVINQRGGRVVAFFAIANGAQFRLILVLGLDKEGELLLSSTEVASEYPSLTLECPQFHWFERELAELHGITPQGHPWLKPIRFNRDAVGPGLTEYFTMGGDAVHEVSVGPVHAGVIEPGHFRFQCLGEDVFSLEISLGYQHRGIEKRLLGGPDKRSIHLLETACGDSSCAYAGAYSQIIEQLSPSLVVSERDQALRVIAWEFERLANHTGDLGAMAGDVAFRPTMGYCGRIRGEFLNMTAELCGNRFGRGLLVPGGCGFDVDRPLCERLLKWLEKTGDELINAVDLLFEAATVQDRFENTGTVSPEVARQIGLVGVAGRASAQEQDTRKYFPYGKYCQIDLSPAFVNSGDVFARAQVRRMELLFSVRVIKDLLRNLPPAEKAAEQQPLAAERIAISLVEAWRGELCHIALTDAAGKFSKYKVVDPSFHNWFGLSMALRDEQISNFPLCNKSFNLSYCGHDL